MMHRSLEHQPDKVLLRLAIEACAKSPQLAPHDDFAGVVLRGGAYCLNRDGFETVEELGREILSGRVRDKRARWELVPSTKVQDVRSVIDQCSAAESSDDLGSERPRPFALCPGDTKPASRHSARSVVAPGPRALFLRDSRPPGDSGPTRMKPSIAWRDRRRAEQSKSVVVHSQRSGRYRARFEVKLVPPPRKWDRRDLGEQVAQVVRRQNVLHQPERGGPDIGRSACVPAI